jgi:hypothetical protein
MKGTNSLLLLFVAQPAITFGYAFDRQKYDFRIDKEKLMLDEI